ncbi:dicer-like protein 4 [Quercus suber]|uniref:Dicer-like protein 4 n=1 Tax=Quercus suber TaxID=58331 RepID=A0AAW0L430_QUESU
MTSVGSEGTECDTVGSESESATSSMVPVGAMLESVGAEYCLFGDRLWDDHIAVLLIHELGHLIRKPQKGICIILTHTVALVQQTHIHIIPRKAHDCLWPSEFRGRRLKLDQDVFKLVDSVREQLSVSNNTKNDWKRWLLLEV